MSAPLRPSKLGMFVFHPIQCDHDNQSHNADNCAEELCYMKPYNEIKIKKLAHEHQLNTYRTIPSRDLGYESPSTRRLSSNPPDSTYQIQYPTFSPNGFDMACPNINDEKFQHRVNSQNTPLKCNIKIMKDPHLHTKKDRDKNKLYMETNQNPTNHPETAINKFVIDYETTLLRGIPDSPTIRVPFYAFISIFSKKPSNLRVQKSTIKFEASPLNLHSPWIGRFNIPSGLSITVSTIHQTSDNFDEMNSIDSIVCNNNLKNDPLVVFGIPEDTGFNNDNSQGEASQFGSRPDGHRGFKKFYQNYTASSQQKSTDFTKLINHDPINSHEGKKADLKSSIPTSRDLVISEKLEKKLKSTIRQSSDQRQTIQIILRVAKPDGPALCFWCIQVPFTKTNEAVDRMILRQRNYQFTKENVQSRLIGAVQIQLQKMERRRTLDRNGDWQISNIESRKSGSPKYSINNCRLVFCLGEESANIYLDKNSKSGMKDVKTSPILGKAPISVVTDLLY